MNTVHLLHFHHLPVLEQLQLEEALLRTDNRNWCIINEGTPPAIVMGISGQPERLLNGSKIAAKPIPVIKRFSGGGTVVVDEHTVFVTFIFNQELLRLPCYPEPIMKWTGTFYSKALQNKDFALKENDYVFGERKCGGNAQYIKKNRWLHHSSFLWDFDNEKMSYLLLPEKRPQYRQGRTHEDFLCRLNAFLPSKETFIASVKRELSQNFDLLEISFNEIEEVLNWPHRRATELVKPLL